MRVSYPILLLLAALLGAAAGQSCPRCGSIGDACDPDFQDPMLYCPDNSLCVGRTNQSDPDTACVAKLSVVRLLLKKNTISSSYLSLGGGLWSVELCVR